MVNWLSKPAIAATSIGRSVRIVVGSGMEQPLRATDNAHLSAEQRESHITESRRTLPVRCSAWLGATTLAIGLRPRFALNLHLPQRAV